MHSLQLSIADTPHKPQLHRGACCARCEVDIHSSGAQLTCFAVVTRVLVSMHVRTSRRHNKSVVAPFQNTLHSFSSFHRSAMEEDSITFRGALLIAWWPFSKCISGVQIVLTPVLRLVLVLLSPIWAVASLGGFLLLPLVHLAKGLLNIVTFPLQVKWLERIEVCILLDEWIH